MSQAKAMTKTQAKGGLGEGGSYVLQITDRFMPPTSLYLPESFRRKSGHLRSGRFYEQRDELIFLERSVVFTRGLVKCIHRSRSRSSQYSPSPPLRPHGHHRPLSHWFLHRDRWACSHSKSGAICQRGLLLAL
jgi:hypothetical protein